MPANRPAPRRLLAMIALAVLLIAAAAPAVSAQIIIDETLSETRYTGGDYTYSLGLTAPSGTWNVNVIRLKNAQNYTDINYIGLTVTNFYEVSNVLPEGTHETTYTYNGVTNPCNIYVAHDRNYLGQLQQYRFLIFPQNWNDGGLTGLQTITLGTSLYKQGSSSGVSANKDVYLASSNRLSEPIPGKYKLIISSSYTSINNLIVSMPTNNDYEVNLIREVEGVSYPSRIDLKKGESIVLYNEETSDFYHIINKDAIDTVLVTLGSNTYTYPLTSSAPPTESNTVTVYVRNSQTGALLADAHIEIQDTTTEPWTEVVNQTLSSGQVTISLPKDSGIHFTQYRIGATVPGYQQVVPALFFRVTGPTNVVIEMEPVEGGPVNEDNAYLEFYVRDLNANGIPNANVLVDGQLRWTNAQGYTQIEVAKNASYPYSVSKSGYVTIEGTATVADGPRYVVNVVLGPGSVPTYTPGPGETPGATPTPDTRTNEQKGQAIIDLIADFAEPIAILAILATIFGLLKMMTPGRR